MNIVWTFWNESLILEVCFCVKITTSGVCLKGNHNVELCATHRLARPATIVVKTFKEQSIVIHILVRSIRQHACFVWMKTRLQKRQ
jgi:hypothetical protein